MTEDAVAYLRLRGPRADRKEPILYWPGYGFVMPGWITTNGHAGALLNYLRARCEQRDEEGYRSWLENPDGSPLSVDRFEEMCRSISSKK